MQARLRLPPQRLPNDEDFSSWLDDGTRRGIMRTVFQQFFCSAISHGLTTSGILRFDGSRNA
jgi:hypothetical protein